MNTTIRNRAAALGIAAIAGLAGVAITGGSALASASPQSGHGSSAQTAVAADAQSDGHPGKASKYADELMRAWDLGSDAEVAKHATPGVVEAMTDHGDEHASRWDRIAAEGTVASTSVVYKNKTTGELLTFTVDNHNAALGKAHAIHHIQFRDKEQSDD